VLGVDGDLSLSFPLLSYCLILRIRSTVTCLYVLMQVLSRARTCETVFVKKMMKPDKEEW
jgi:hypothetical protein